MKKLLIGLSVLIIVGIVGYKLYDRYFYSGEFIFIKTYGSAIYHRVNCPLVKKATFNSIKIISKEEIARNEYRPCKTCNPPYDTKYILEIRKIKSEKKKIAEAKIAENHKKLMIKMKEEYISGYDRSVSHALELYREKYVSKNRLAGTIYKLSK